MGGAEPRLIHRLATAQAPGSGLAPEAPDPVTTLKELTGSWGEN